MMRTAAMRTLAFAIVIFAIGVTIRAVELALRGVDAALFHIALGAAMGILLVWIASLVLRHPRVFARMAGPLVIALLMLPVASQSWDGTRDVPHLTSREREAFEYLRTTEQFEMPAVGIAGEPSYGFVAMRILGRAAHADAAFKELLHNGTTAGQLYGLIGIRRTDPVYFATVSRIYANRTDDISVLSGCVIMDQPITSIVEVPSNVFLDRGVEAYERRVRDAETRYDFVVQRKAVQ